MQCHVDLYSYLCILNPLLKLSNIAEWRWWCSIYWWRLATEKRNGLNCELKKSAEAKHVGPSEAMHSNPVSIGKSIEMSIEMYGNVNLRNFKQWWEHCHEVQRAKSCEFVWDDLTGAIWMNLLWGSKHIKLLKVMADAILSEMMDIEVQVLKSLAPHTL